MSTYHLRLMCQQQDLLTVVQHQLARIREVPSIASAVAGVAAAGPCQRGCSGGHSAEGAGCLSERLLGVKVWAGDEVRRGSPFEEQHPQRLFEPPY